MTLLLLLIFRTKFYARLDNTNCQSQCFPDAEQAAEFLAQAVRQGYNPGYTLYSVNSKNDFSEATVLYFPAYDLLHLSFTSK